MEINLRNCRNYSEFLRCLALLTDDEVNKVVQRVHNFSLRPLKASFYEGLVRSRKKPKLSLFRRKSVLKETREEKVKKLLKLSMFVTEILDLCQTN